jgi:hypothetical protein
MVLQENKKQIEGKKMTNFNIEHKGVIHSFNAWTNEKSGKGFCEGPSGTVCWNSDMSIDEMRALAEKKVKETFENELSHFFTFISL